MSRHQPKGGHVTCSLHPIVPEEAGELSTPNQQPSCRDPASPLLFLFKQPWQTSAARNRRENPHRTPTQQRWCGGGTRVPLLELINYLSFGDSNTEHGEPQEKWPKGTISVHSLVTTLGTSEINGPERSIGLVPNTSQMSQLSHKQTSTLGTSVPQVKAQGVKSE